MVLLLFLILFGMTLGAVLVMWARPSEHRMLSEQIQHNQDRLSSTSIAKQKGEVSDQPMPDAHVREKPRSVDNQEPTIRKAPCNMHGSMTMQGLDADASTPYSRSTVTSITWDNASTYSRVIMHVSVEFPCVLSVSAFAWQIVDLRHVVSS